MAKKNYFNYTTKKKDEKEEQELIKKMAVSVFDDFLVGKYHIDSCYENDMLIITPYVNINDDDDGDIICYTIRSKSNTDAEIYVDRETITLSLGNIPISVTSDAILVAITNMMSFVDKYFN